jgi:hypothetical protein
MNRRINPNTLGWLLFAGLLVAIGYLVVNLTRTRTQMLQSIEHAEASNVYISKDGAYSPIDLETQIREADTIAIAKVQTIGHARWNTQNGKAPDQATVQQLIREGKEIPFIYREVIVLAEKYMKNPQPNEALQIAILGGEVDGTIFDSNGPFEPEIGMTVVLFLTEENSPSPVKWGIYAAYVVESDIAYSMWDNRQILLQDLLDQIVNSL